MASSTLRLVAVLAAPWVVGCPSTPYPEAKVELGAGAPAAPQPPPDEAPSRLRFSVAAMLSPQGTYGAYSALFELLAGRLGDRIEFVQRRTYREVNDLLASGRLDAAIVCTGGFLELERQAPGRVEVLAVPVVGGVSTYRSYVLVPAASAARSLEDLAGKRFAYTDELSLSGRAWVVHRLRRLGRDPTSFFATVELTGSHDRSIEAVAKGVVDGASVDSLIFDDMAKARPELAKAVRIIEASPPFGAAPVVASTALSPGRRAAIRHALLALADDAEGRKALAATGFERFVRPPPSLYDDAREVMGAIR